MSAICTVKMHNEVLIRSLCGKQLKEGEKGVVQKQKSRRNLYCSIWG